MDPRLRRGSMCFLYGSDTATLEATKLLTIWATLFILKSIHRFYFLCPNQEPSLWASCSFSVLSSAFQRSLQAWAHRSRCLPPNRCFMSSRHLNNIMCKTDLHCYLTILQLPHFFLFSKIVPARFQGVVLYTSTSCTHHIYAIIQVY